MAAHCNLVPIVVPIMHTWTDDELKNYAMWFHRRPGVDYLDLVLMPDLGPIGDLTVPVTENLVYQEVRVYFDQHNKPIRVDRC